MTPEDGRARGTDDEESPERETATERSYPEIDPATYYDSYGEDEWERLDRSPKARFEFENTVAYLSEHLPDEGHVLDAGGAAGRYAIWLAERGYDVTLTDVSETQLDLAREKVAEHGVEDRVRIEYGDLRDLPFEDGTFDAVLALGGPLSHVIDSEERERAVRELRRVATPGAPAVVSVMGLIAVVERMLQVAPEFEQGVRQLPGLLASGTYSADLLEKADVEDPTFVETHFFRADELRDLLSSNGFSVATMAGLEGVASNFEEPLGEASDESLETIREVVLDPEFREDPTVVDASNHILAVGHATELADD
ncbi:MAG TPA: methyltransferase domain-containing protein [Natrialbaceae archaeon]|nr:methyltransferase domain-containing protein [Natrialbaceae archaeon]